LKTAYIPDIGVGINVGVSGIITQYKIHCRKKEKEQRLAELHGTSAPSFLLFVCLFVGWLVGWSHPIQSLTRRGSGNHHHYIYGMFVNYNMFYVQFVSRVSTSYTILLLFYFFDIMAISDTVVEKKVRPNWKLSL